VIYDAYSILAFVLDAGWTPLRLSVRMVLLPAEKVLAPGSNQNQNQ